MRQYVEIKVKTDRIEELVTSGSFPGISFVKITIDEKAEKYVYGFCDAKKEISVHEDTIFHACSISKWITAIVTMQLVEKGVLQPDADIAGYIKKWKLDYADDTFQKVTLRHLLSHTSGIVDGNDGFYGLRRNSKPITLTDILSGKTAYNNVPAFVHTNPGTNFEYSDAGYCLIQLVIEEATGENYETVAERELFKPLELSNTFFGTPENFDRFENEKTVAVGWQEDGSLIEEKYAYCPDLAASGLWSTPTDLAAIAIDFMQSLEGKGTVLSKEGALEMIRKAFGIDWIGLGIFRYDDSVLVSKGWGEDAQCMLKMDLKKKCVWVIMGNCDPGMEQEKSGIAECLEYN